MPHTRPTRAPPSGRPNTMALGASRCLRASNQQFAEPGKVRMDRPEGTDCPTASVPAHAARVIEPVQAVAGWRSRIASAVEIVRPWVPLLIIAVGIALR